MRTPIFIVMLMLATGAARAGPITEGFWASGEAGISVSFGWPDFTIFRAEPEETIDCQITDWPISTPVATGECEDGSRHSIEIHADRVIFDGYPLTQTFEAPD